MVGSLTRAQIQEIAALKLPDLNAKDIEGAIRTVEGTARSMGVEVVD
jgi:large subunit ribosomal protein L11